MSGIFVLLNHNLCSLKNQNYKKDAKYKTFTINQNILLGYCSVTNECFTNDINTVTIVFEGEIYNKGALYSLLQLIPKTNMDSEVIYYLYNTYGLEKALSLLDGIFTFVLYDSNLHNEDSSFTQKIFIVRDPLGVNPLYTFTQNLHYLSTYKEKRYAFGFGYDKASFTGYFDKSNSELSLFRAGTYSKYELSFKTFSEWKMVSENIPYYLLPSTMTTTLRNDIDNIDWYIQGINIHFREAIRKRCQYLFDLGINVESGVGCLLTGGFKSSLLATLVKKEFQRILGKDVVLQTCSVGLKDSVVLKQAKETSEFLDTKHYEIMVSKEEMISSLRDVISVVETEDKKIIRDGIGTFLAGKWIRENTEIQFLFHGEGGDALCGGFSYMSNMEKQIDFETETRKLVTQVSQDVLVRCNKCLSTHFIKPMTPFLDLFFVNYYLSIPLHIRSQNVLGRDCLYLLRKAFSENDCQQKLLPQNILERKKKDDEYLGWLGCYDSYYIEMLETTTKTKEENFYHFLFASLFPRLCDF